MIITHGPISGVHEFSHPSNHMRVLLLVTLKSQLLSSGFVSHAAKGSTRFFFLLLLNGHLNTRILWSAKRFNIPTVVCIICSTDSEETLKYLIFECEFAESYSTALHIV
jgi:hypothetical protein